MVDISNQTTIPIPDREALRLVCSELFGGNRPVNTPVHLPDVTGMIYSRPCEGGRGGDVHYLSVCGSGLLSRMCIADVAGHGEPVAKVSTHLHSLLRKFMNQHDQRRVLRSLNVQLERKGIHSMTTAAALSYYPPKRRLSFSYAGHPPGWLYRKRTAQWSRLLLPDSPRPEGAAFMDGPLAVLPGTEFSRAHVTDIQSGDRVLLVTDGVLEAPGKTGEMLGHLPVEQCLSANHTASVADLAKALLNLVQNHVGDRGMVHDDVTFMLLQFDPSPWRPAIWSAARNRLLRPRGNARERQTATV